MRRAPVSKKGGKARGNGDEGEEREKGQEESKSVVL
jgi:hypothetical protein